jgi:hypothetical protein
VIRSLVLLVVLRSIIGPGCEVKDGCLEAFAWMDR